MPDPAGAMPAPAPAITGPAGTAPATATPTPGAADPAPAGTAPAGTVLATVVDTPIGPLSLLARGGQLIAGGFTADPAVMHARLAAPLRALPLRDRRPGRPALAGQAGRRLLRR